MLVQCILVAKRLIAGWASVLAHIGVGTAHEICRLRGLTPGAPAISTASAAEQACSPGRDSERGLAALRFPYQPRDMPSFREEMERKATNDKESTDLAIRVNKENADLAIRVNNENSDLALREVCYFVFSASQT